MAFEIIHYDNDRIEGIREYDLGHSREVAFDRTNNYCPACGEKDVWVADEEGDYYMGPDYFCRECGVSGSHWSGDGEYDVYLAWRGSYEKGDKNGSV